MVSAADVKAVMKRAGIDADLVDGMKPDVPMLSQGLESIDLPTIAIAAEKLWHIPVDDADSAKLQTIDSFAVYVNAKLGGKK